MTNLPLDGPAMIRPGKVYRAAGTQVLLSNARILEAHLSGSQNRQTLALDVAEHSVHDSLTLERPGHESATWHGIQVTLQLADAYQNQATIVVSRAMAVP